jgi:predicted unusual protein kinase regulating ubiquinone biosynthesis (AarF/ABC1/UbiB family)
LRVTQARVALQGLDEAAAQADASATHTRIAERMRDLALEQGGIYVKGGQHICAQPIIPHECVTRLHACVRRCMRANKACLMP